MKLFRKLLVLLVATLLLAGLGACAGHEMFRPADYRAASDPIFVPGASMGEEAPPPDLRPARARTLGR